MATVWRGMPQRTPTREEYSALIRSHAAYTMARAYEYRMIAESLDGQDKERAMLGAAHMAWLSACFWLEIERFACR